MPSSTFPRRGGIRRPLPRPEPGPTPPPSNRHRTVRITLQRANHAPRRDPNRPCSINLITCRLRKRAPTRPFRSGGCLARAGTLSGKKLPGGLAHFHVILWGAFNSLLFLVDGSMMGRWVPVRGRGPIRRGSWPNHCERGSVFQPANRRSTSPRRRSPWRVPCRGRVCLLPPLFFLNIPVVASLWVGRLLSVSDFQAGREEERRSSFRISGLEAADVSDRHPSLPSPSSLLVRCGLRLSSFHPLLL